MTEKSEGEKGGGGERRERRKRKKNGRGRVCKCMAALLTTSRVHVNLYPSHTYQGVSRCPFHSTPHCTLEDTGSSPRRRFLHSGSAGSQLERVWLLQ